MPPWEWEAHPEWRERVSAIFSAEDEAEAATAQAKQQMSGKT